jgi:hypothetical protein
MRRRRDETPIPPGLGTRFALVPNVPHEVILDCHDLDTALKCLAGLLETSVEELGAAVSGHDESRFDGTEDPFVRMPNDVAEVVGANLEAIQLAGAYYFHGTRVVDPSAFKDRGILPLGALVESIWSTLGELVQDVCTRTEWADFRRSVEVGDAGGWCGSLYRMKSRGAMHHGPFAELVRETLIYPRESHSHDYLGCPEIVEDIAACFSAAYGVSLAARFSAAATPTIVKFFVADAGLGEVRTALWYAYYRLWGEKLSRQSCWAFDGKGQAVQSGHIAQVETVQV